MYCLIFKNFRPTKNLDLYTAFSEPLFCINIRSLYIYTFSGWENQAKTVFSPDFSRYGVERSAADHLRGHGLIAGHLSRWSLERLAAKHFGACLNLSLSLRINMQKSTFLQGFGIYERENSTNADFFTFAGWDFVKLNIELYMPPYSMRWLSYSTSALPYSIISILTPILPPSVYRV